MKLIVGLGNPELRYFRTRHNVGRLVVESIARLEQAVFSRKRTLKASIASLTWGEEKIVLAYPETYMNRSGEAVSALVRYFKISFHTDLLVLVDDLALPLGKLRLRPSGSDGGHNGLRSIHQYLSSSEYPRLRIGIGHPSRSDKMSGQHVSVENYVLSSFDREETEFLPGILQAGSEACRLWALESVEKAMSTIN